MSTAKYRGHKIESISDIWIYSDNKQPVSDDKNRPCGHCGKPETKEGHDGCIGTLKGVMNACCGHGTIGEAYIQYSDESIIRGQLALDGINKIYRRKK